MKEADYDKEMSLAEQIYKAHRDHGHPYAMHKAVESLSPEMLDELRKRKKK